MPPSSRGADLDERPNLRGSGSHDSPSKLSNKTSKLVSSAIVEKLKPMAARVKTLTFDNGKEFARHAYIDEKLESTAYFARPFAGWERGSNENLNGLLRQYVPKKRVMSTVIDEEI
jgi:IS30 family transposase